MRLGGGQRPGERQCDDSDKIHKTSVCVTSAIEDELISPIASMPFIYQGHIHVTRNINGEYVEWLIPEIMHRSYINLDAL